MDPQGIYNIKTTKQSTMKLCPYFMDMLYYTRNNFEKKSIWICIGYFFLKVKKCFGNNLNYHHHIITKFHQIFYIFVILRSQQILLKIWCKIIWCMWCKSYGGILCWFFSNILFSVLRWVNFSSHISKHIHISLHKTEWIMGASISIFVR